MADRGRPGVSGYDKVRFMFTEIPSEQTWAIPIVISIVTYCAGHFWLHVAAENNDLHGQVYNAKALEAGLGNVPDRETLERVLKASFPNDEEAIRALSAAVELARHSRLEESLTKMRNEASWRLSVTALVAALWFFDHPIGALTAVALAWCSFQISRRGAISRC